MARRVSILLYGRDSRLQDSRKWLLEASGYKVGTAMDPARVEQILADETIDLLILCHSLTLEDKGRVIAACQLRWPKMKCLFLTAGVTTVEELTANALSTWDGPAMLVQRVQTMLGSEENAGSDAPEARLPLPPE